MQCVVCALRVAVLTNCALVMVQSIRFSHLPLMRIMFLSNSAIVGAGYDFNPMLFSQDANNFWFEACWVARLSVTGD
jgi:hypothetical protein